MDIGLRDQVKAIDGPLKGTVIAITSWAVDGDADKTERWDIGIRTSGTDRISWADSETLRITKKAG